jgi:peptide methionine sulfoxide reductase MsrA
MNSIVIALSEQYSDIGSTSRSSLFINQNSMQEIMKTLLTDASSRSVDGAHDAIMKAEPFTPWDSAATGV